MVKVLLAAGARTSAVNNFGKTAAELGAFLGECSQPVNNKYPRHDSLVSTLDFQLIHHLHFWYTYLVKNVNILYQVCINYVPECSDKSITNQEAFVRLPHNLSTVL